ncbi:MAG: hypothetical protein CENE_01895 [Candidatus Celerinatantimonas neptuna]|nr:MAG: hypothetical protein CENE_01895 [Candidatus Celerinatantimonas neptuna]
MAADAQKLPRPTITNIIKQLETRLVIRLLERPTKQVHLTHEDALYYQRYIHSLADLDNMESLFSQTQPKGNLRVNLQGTQTKHFVIPHINKFLTCYPDITLHIDEDDRLIDLVREGVD